MAKIPTLEKIKNPEGKRVLVRADLNVPMKDGKVSDAERIERLLPTVKFLQNAKAKVIILSHFGRPKGKVVPEMSLRPVAEELARRLGSKVAFASDCVGPEAKEAVAKLKDGDVLVLENTRFHAGDEGNDPQFAKELAENGDVFVNDAFSAAHRAHASTTGISKDLPTYAGREMESELKALASASDSAEHPIAAIVGGSKVSTKLAVLENMIDKVDVLAIGGAMANTFLAAQGVSVGKSLEEPEMHETARKILAKAKVKGCEIILPVDAVVASKLENNAPTEVCDINNVPADKMILDVGPKSAEELKIKLSSLKTLLWNGPLGAFEFKPFDAATDAIAKETGRLTKEGKLKSIVGGGDTVASLRQAGVLGEMSHVSTAGGAFLEWMEGKALPAVVVLEEVGRSLGLA
ncbi:phosphoglycerate kinase [Acetobacteraceae bacterium]|nr:phosphoglycerate kinase [Acetobacteraceae bacterium]